MEDQPNAPQRTLVLALIDGKKPISSTGNVDHRLFNGENNLRVILEQGTNLWSFKYDYGNVPEPLRQKFTRFDFAKTFAEAYFDKRNIKIVDVINHNAN